MLRTVGMVLRREWPYITVKVDLTLFLILKILIFFNKIKKSHHSHVSDLVEDDTHSIPLSPGLTPVGRVLWEFSFKEFSKAFFQNDIYEKIASVELDPEPTSKIWRRSILGIRIRLALRLLFTTTTWTWLIISNKKFIKKMFAILNDLFLLLWSTGMGLI